ncbi:MFS transporter [Kitasatospora sp. NPDC058048]|uniref:MFS transporter n=1 Tax=Kitasatospora sp. NPDC058048 TaxID=3346313 RepID=UPI0036D9FB3D
MTTANAESAAPAEHRKWARVIPAKGPQRVLATSQLINNLGNGMFITGQALFFTRSVGLPVGQVATGLGISAFIGLLVGIPVGRLADRYGSREAYAATMTIEGVAAVSLVFVHTFWSFLALVCITQMAQTGSLAARSPMLRALGGEKPAEFRAYLRTLTNIAFPLGAAVAMAAIQVGTRSAYLTLILGNALSYFVCALLMTRIPHVPPKPAPPQTSRWIALRDKPFLAVTLHEGLLATQLGVLTFALPLWIVSRTEAPRWTIGLGLLVNTVLCVAFQIRFSKGVDSPGAAGRVLRRAGFAYLVAAFLLALMAGVPGWAAVLLLIPGAAIHTIGEMWQSSAGFELSFGLAPEHAQGQYSAVYNMGFGFANAVAPPVLALLCITWGRPGWFVLGALFGLLGLAGPPLVAWAERTR